MSSEPHPRKFLECGGLAPLWFNVEIGMISLICLRRNSKSDVRPPHSKSFFSSLPGFGEYGVSVGEVAWTRAGD